MNCSLCCIGADCDAKAICAHKTKHTAIALTVKCQFTAQKPSYIHAMKLLLYDQIEIHGIEMQIPVL